jgi:hypothetical protein
MCLDFSSSDAHNCSGLIDVLLCLDSDGAWDFSAWGVCIWKKASQIARALNENENEIDEPSTLTSTTP